MPPQMTEPPVPLEAEEAEKLVDKCNTLAYQYPKLAFIFHVPNGAYLGINRQKYGAKMKLMGVKRGVPDYILPVWNGEKSGLCIELKRRKSYPSDTEPEQLEWQAFLNAENYLSLICKGWKEAWNAICDYLSGVYPEIEKEKIK